MVNDRDSHWVGHFRGQQETSLGRSHYKSTKAKHHWVGRCPIQQLEASQETSPGRSLSWSLHSRKQHTGNSTQDTKLTLMEAYQFHQWSGEKWRELPLHGYHRWMNEWMIIYSQLKECPRKNAHADSPDVVMGRWGPGGHNFSHSHIVKMHN